MRDKTPPKLQKITYKALWQVGFQGPKWIQGDEFEEGTIIMRSNRRCGLERGYRDGEKTGKV